MKRLYFMVLLFTTTILSFGQGMYCNYNSTPIIVDGSNSPYNAPIDCEHDFIINAGGELVFQGGTFYMGPGVMITVNRKGKVTIDDATLKVDQTCSSTSINYWDGILVNGNSSARQWDRWDPSNNEGYFDETTLDHGYVEITNSTIMHMKPVSGFFGGIKSVNGGVIRAYNSYFENNLTAITFENYTPVTPPGWPAGREVENASKIEECDFSWNNFLTWGTTTYTSYITYYHIILSHVENMIFEGNLFENASPHTGANSRGTGILSLESSFVVHPSKMTGTDENGCPQYSGNSVITTFQDLGRGIRFSNNDDDLGFAIHKCDFDDNQYSIFTEGGRNILIHECDFMLDKDNILFNGTSGDFFIKMIGGILNQVAENYFESDYDEITFVYLIDAANNNIPTSFYKNVLNANTGGSNTAYANRFEGDNSDLTLHCNAYTNFYRDWYIYDGNLGYQGSASMSAGNVYSKDGNVGNNISNHGSYFTIYWGSNAYEKPNDDQGHINEISNNPENSCPDLDCENPYPTSIKDHSSLHDKLNIYPNPVFTEISMIIPNNVIEGVIEIINSKGEVILSEPFRNEGVLAVNVTNLENGIYICRIISNKDLVWKGRFIKL